MHCHLGADVQHVPYAVHFVAIHSLFVMLELRDPSGSVCSAFHRLPDEGKGIDSMPRLSKPIRC